MIKDHYKKFLIISLVFNLVLAISILAIHHEKNDVKKGIVIENAYQIERECNAYR